MFDRHEEYSNRVKLSPERLFALLDDQRRLSAHMSKRSWTMGWGKLDTLLDDGRGQTVGSHIVLHGRVFGIRLHLDEVVTLREPPFRKRWQTVGEPRLLVIGAYEMGFEIFNRDGDAQLRVDIDYALPRRGFSRLLGRVFGRSYARWCVKRMVDDASTLNSADRELLHSAK